MRHSPLVPTLLALAAATAVLLDPVEAPAATAGCGEATGAICSETETCSGFLLWRNCTVARSYSDGSLRDDASGGGGGSGF